LVTDRFIAFPISTVSSVPEAPTNAPLMMSTLLPNTKPVEAAANPDERVQQRDDDRHVGAADRQHE